jgi:hypothetical protein
MVFKRVTHVFLSGKLSSTVIIPIDIARKHRMDEKCNVTVEDTKDGVLIKRIDF